MFGRIISMTQDEKRIWLIEKLLAEDSYYKNYEIPGSVQEQKDLLRALMNVRDAKPVSDEFLKVQDEYLGHENKSGLIVDAASLTSSKRNDRLFLWQGDITSLKVDAIVNAANSGMCGCFRPLHNCVDNIIHTKSGIQLRLKCSDIMKKQGHEEPTGRAKITPAYNLPCEYVIHTVGPIVQGSLTKEHEQLLKSCYSSCLSLAEEYSLKSIAFCCISTGVFMFPNGRAAEIAVETCEEFLREHSGIERIIFNVFKDIDLEIYQNLLER
jgi:O-acetyl-ADP-ribose deacetylase (regulator of RNase III)